jgi:ABC-type methionine transport system ATPase subunit
MLSFPSELATEPVIYNLGMQFRVVTNIYRASITEDMGWMILELEGKEEDIEHGVAWAIGKGVRVEWLGNDEGSLYHTA